MKIVLNEKELAENLGVSYWTVRLWRLKLGLPHFRTEGRIFYRWESIMKWMGEQEEQTNVTDPQVILPIAQ
ncbi:DNA-binding protein [Pectinatus brassicae]|uniref:Putative site-specific integrase-resolvase n=1 Tax=Pectinatus brassicae TaxID=862415 RepID=A0A840UTJ0_9FIRM|nr:DNA-binding protein [Pectinatus brassicae]MBB5336134.1 putative site-specific integrase-resolvase [Pectinatus brassicae]